VFLCFDEPISVHTESAVCLLVLVCCGTNLRVGEQMLHNLDFIGIDFYLERLWLDLCSRRDLSVVGHDGCI
jgi:hypothetical protein